MSYVQIRYRLSSQGCLGRTRKPRAVISCIYQINQYLRFYFAPRDVWVRGMHDMILRRCMAPFSRYTHVYSISSVLYVNCILFGVFSDFGMARDVYETDYYRKEGKGIKIVPCKKYVCKFKQVELVCDCMYVACLKL